MRGDAHRGRRSCAYGTLTLPPATDVEALRACSSAIFASASAAYCTSGRFKNAPNDSRVVPRVSIVPRCVCASGAQCSPAASRSQTPPPVDPPASAGPAPRSHREHPIRCRIPCGPDTLGPHPVHRLHKRPAQILIVLKQRLDPLPQHPLHPRRQPRNPIALCDPASNRSGMNSGCTCCSEIVPVPPNRSGLIRPSNPVVYTTPPSQRPSSPLCPEMPAGQSLRCT